MTRLAIVAAALMAAASPLAAQTIAITNGTLVLGDGSEPIQGGMAPWDTRRYASIPGWAFALTR